MLEKLKNLLFKKELPPTIVDPEVQTKATEKQAATIKGDPWVDVIDVELSKDNISNGAFTLDWNDIFVARLIKAGYKGKDDNEIVNAWFTDICRNVVLETYEQEQADPEKRAANNRDLGDGRREFR